MQKNNWWPFIIFSIVLLIFTTEGRIIPLLIFVYIIYRVFKTVTGQEQFNLEDYVKNKFEKNTINLDPDQKGGFGFSNNFSQFKMSDLKPKYIIIAIAAILTLFIILDGLVSVPPGHVAVIYDRGRGVLPNELKEGLHLKVPFWQKSQLFMVKKQVFTMAGEFRGILDEDAVRARSKDGQDVTIDTSITYVLEGKNAPKVYQEFITENTYRQTIVNPAARSVVYDAASKFNALDLVSEKRDDFRDLIIKDLSKIYDDNRIKLAEVFIRNVTFSTEFAKEIEDKQIQEQRKQTEKNRKEAAREIAERVAIEAKGQADAIRELALGEADSIRAKGDALKSNQEVIQLEFINKMAPQISWGILPDGALPLIDIRNMQNQ